MLKPKTTIVVDPNDPFHASCSACKHDFRMRAPLETSSDGWKCVTCGHENPKGALRCQNAKCTVLSYSPEKARREHQLRKTRYCDYDMCPHVFDPAHSNNDH